MAHFVSNTAPPRPELGTGGPDRRLGGGVGAKRGALAQGAIQKVGQVFLGLWRNSCYKFIMV